MNLEENLKELGLIGSEIKVYLYLLEQGISSPSQIAKGTKIARTNCYHILLDLKNKSLVEEQAKGKRKVYIANDPNALLQTLNKKKEVAERIIPDLRALYTVQKNKPKIKFFDGVEQIKEIYKQTLSAEKIYAFASAKDMFDAMPDLFEWYGDEITKRDIVFKEIATHKSKESEKKIKEKLKWQYEYKLLDEKYGDFQTDLLIWNDNISVITYEEPFFGTVITNSTIAKTYKVLFKALWDRTEN